jgi:DNA-binding IclR family transcriptional regulator
VTAVRRSSEILDVLAAEGQLGTTAIARRLGTTPSTISRALGTLVEADLVEHDPGSGRYRLGLRLVQLGNAVLARLDVREIARPQLAALVAEVDETATLSIPGDPDAITIDVVQASHQVQGVTQLGRPSIAHATAAGKVMLAFAERVPQPPLRRYTPRTITSVAKLEAELARVRSRGWADAYEEREPELNAIAAPVFDASDLLVGIVALQGPVRRFGRAAAKRALPLLLARTHEISRALGRDA